MGYNYWTGIYRFKEELHGHELHERQGKRTGMPPWDEKWNRLSSQARLAFLSEAKYQSSADAQQRYRTSVPADKFPEQALKELRAAGFVQVSPGTTPKKPSRVEVTAEAIEFALRLRAIRRYRLLHESSTDDLRRYVQHGFFTYALLDELEEILDTAGLKIETYYDLDTVLNSFVIYRRWPEWVAHRLKDPLAEPILKAVREAGGSIDITALATKIRNAKPEQVRDSVEKLLARLALFEGIDPKTGLLLVGFLPPVLEGMIAAEQPRKPPELVVVEDLKSIGPTTGFAIDDLRAFLLELAAEPPKVRQDGGIFQKHLDRFHQALEPLPDWFIQSFELTPEGRLNQAFQLARRLQLVISKVEQNTSYLTMTQAGERWLAGSIDQQYLRVYQHLRELGKAADAGYDEEFGPWVFNQSHSFGGWSFLSRERDFLGVEVSIQVVNSEQNQPRKSSARSNAEPVPDHSLELRRRIHRGLGELEVGVFYQLESILECLSMGERNPLLLGKQYKDIRIYLEGKLIPPLEELMDSACAVVFASLILHKLVPMGCLQAAIDEQGQLLLARHPRLDAYFGQQVAPEEISGTTIEGSKVVVQPDFSIIVIGPNPAPVAELAPFCERTQGRSRSAHGASTLKLTRESILKAVANGLTAEEIEKRLRRHATVDLPPNVSKQVHAWASWVRQVDPQVYQVFSCPDPETADRVLSLLGRSAERFNATTIGYPSATLDAATRRKLRDGGILSEPTSLSSTAPSRASQQRKRRERYY